MRPRMERKNSKLIASWTLIGGALSLKWERGGAVRDSYDQWRDGLLRLWPDARIAPGHAVVRACSMGMVVGEWSNTWTFWVKTLTYKSACLDAQIWEQTIGGTGRRALAGAKVAASSQFLSMID